MTEVSNWFIPTLLFINAYVLCYRGGRLIKKNYFYQDSKHLKKRQVIVINTCELSTICSGGFRGHREFKYFEAPFLELYLPMIQIPSLPFFKS